MRFWIREILGWLLVLLGLYVLLDCFMMLRDPRTTRILSAGPIVVIGIIIFRGGIHLLKVAVAARVCLAAQATQAASAKRA